MRLSKEHRADLRIWDMFLESFNGWSLWLESPVSNADLVLFTDAAGSAGVSLIFGGTGMPSHSLQNEVRLVF